MPREATPAFGPCYQTVQFSYGQTRGTNEWAWGGSYQWTYSGLFSPTGMADVLQDALQHAAGCSSDVLYTTWPRTEVCGRSRILGIGMASF